VAKRNNDPQTICDLEEMQQIGKQYMEGIPTTVLASMHYVTVTTINNYLVRLGIERRKKYCGKWKGYKDYEGESETSFAQENNIRVGRLL
jgi:hypothetical protein